jgi:5-methylcytosine-specific restriction endonuclease McrA
VDFRGRWLDTPPSLNSRQKNQWPLYERQCFLSATFLLEPIPEIWIAARLLRKAVDAHLSGETHRAETLISEADVPAIAKWTDSIWGHRSKDIHRFRSVPNSPPTLAKEMRPKPRMPTGETQRRVRDRDGFFCRFCGIPVIDNLVRKRIHAAYPNALRWGRTDVEQHAAFQCMRLQYDHVLPYSRGGESSFGNFVVTCASCNFGRMEWTLEEVGLMDPRIAPVPPSWDAAAKWNGLEDFI